MRVDGLVFASRRLMVKAQEDRAVDQVVNVAHLPGIVGASVAMPDIHWGYGFPIGGVAATDVEAGGVVSPGGVGFDIGCGVRLLRSELPWDEAAPRLADLVDQLAARIPRGVGGKGLRTLTEADMDAVLATGVRWALDRGIGSDADAELCEDRGSVEGADPGAVSERAKVRGASQLGSLGAGNHFLEVQVVDEIFREREAETMGLAVDRVCVMIHTGSRGLGHQTCTEEIRELDRVMRRLGIEVPDLVYDVSHNLAKLERHEVDGRSKLLCVHRKGATRAFAPGNAEIPRRYAEVGQPVLVPGSMGSASFVLAGVEQGRTLAFASA